MSLFVNTILGVIKGNIIKVRNLRHFVQIYTVCTGKVSQLSVYLGCVVSLPDPLGPV